MHGEGTQAVCLRCRQWFTRDAFARGVRCQDCLATAADATHRLRSRAATVNTTRRWRRVRLAGALCVLPDGGWRVHLVTLAGPTRGPLVAELRRRYAAPDRIELWYGFSGRPPSLVARVAYLVPISACS